MNIVTKICSKCKEEKTSNFTGNICIECTRKYNKEWRDANIEDRRRYTKEYRAKNQEADKAARKRYRDKHKEERKAKGIELRRRNRLTVIGAYGGKCACCGEDRYEFLAVDHVNNNGNVMRGTVHPESPYSYIIRNNFPKDFQILCHNCNASKAYYGYCPHETKELR